jgi:hypothetical protein
MAAMARDAKGHARVKHVDVREHYVRERVEEGDIELECVSSDQNLADLFAKILPRDTHLALVHTLGRRRKCVVEGRRCPWSDV